MKKPVYAAITRKVRPSCEPEFEGAIQRFFKESDGILRSFASDKDRDDFYQYDQFREWGQTVQPLVEPGYTRREIELQGLEAFFLIQVLSGTHRDGKWLS